MTMNTRREGFSDNVPFFLAIAHLLKKNNCVIGPANVV